MVLFHVDFFPLLGDLHEQYIIRHWCGGVGACASCQSSVGSYRFTTNTGDDTRSTYPPSINNV